MSGDTWVSAYEGNFLHDLSFSDTLAGYANVLPLTLLSAGLGDHRHRLSLRASVVTGAVAGVLVTMYVIEPLAFLGVSVAAIALALGAWLFERRDLAA